MKKLLLILAAITLTFSGYSQLVSQPLRNNSDKFSEYKKRFIADGGELYLVNLTQGYMQMAEENGIAESIEFGWMSGGASKQRVDGINSFYTDLYDFYNDQEASQTTASNQPYVSGNIAPNEVPALKEPSGDTRTMAHPSITFTGTLTTVIADYTTGKATVTQTDYTSETRTSISFDGQLYAYFIRSETLTSAQKAAEKSLLEEIYPEIPSVEIGDQTWATSNLEMVATPEGNVIANVTDNTEWSNATTVYDSVYAATSGTADEKEYAALKEAAYWCYYNNDSEIGAVYGKLYNWYAAKLLDLDMESSGYGWRVPTQAQFETLATTLGGTSVAGGKMKVPGLDYWDSPNTGATNESGFSALPAGLRLDDGSLSLNTSCYIGTVSNRRYRLRHDFKDMVHYVNWTMYGVSLRLIKE